MKHRVLVALVAGLAVTAGGCDDPLDVNPRASIPAEEALNDPVEVELAVMGLYDGLQEADGAYGRDAVVFPDLWAETLDFTGTYTSDREVDQNNVAAANTAITGIWGDFYDVVNRANNVLAALPNVADEADAGDLEAWEGQARFARALAYFNLARFFGGVPLVTEPTWSLEGDYQPTRASLADVYALIESDLEEAVGLLPAAGESYTATVYAAEMLLAKALLEQQAADATVCTRAAGLLDDVIDEGPYVLLPDYDDVFAVENNNELVFALEYTVNDANALAFWFFSDHPDFGGRWGFAPSDALMGSYEGLERYEASVMWDVWGQPFNYKFRRIAAGDDDVPVMRLADAHLLRAEANLCAGADAATVVGDINAVRERADVELLDPVEVDTDAELRDAILHERMLELAMEGHRFFDLRRLGVAEDVLGITADQLWLPIPQRELDTNPNLTQNSGY